MLTCLPSTVPRRGQKAVRITCQAGLLFRLACEGIHNPFAGKNPSRRQPVHAGRIERLAKCQHVAARPPEDHADLVGAAACPVWMSKLVDAQIDTAVESRSGGEEFQLTFDIRRGPGRHTKGPLEPPRGVEPLTS